MRNPLLFITCGRTASGKTTLSKFLSKKLKLFYISSSNIKRKHVEKSKKYSYTDSKRESLRDLSYQLCTEIALNKFARNKSVIIDASFHKRKRRDKLFNLVHDRNIQIIVLYTYCPILSEIKKRILKRKNQIKNSSNQADSFEVYSFITNNFEEISNKEISKYNLLFIKIDTYSNRISKIIFKKEQLINSKLMYLLKQYMRQMNNDEL